MSCAKTAEPIEMPFGLWTRDGPRKHVLDGAKGQLLGGRTGHARRHMPDDTLPSAAQKRLNQSICRVGCTVVESGAPKEAQVQAPPGEYD